MSNYFTLPDEQSLILLISTIVFYAYYRLLLRLWLKAYWGGLHLTHQHLLVMRRLRMPLDRLLTELVAAHHSGEPAQQILDILVKSAESGIALTTEQAEVIRRET